MEFELSEEQRLLQDNVARLARSTGPLSGKKARHDREIWSRFAEMGLLGLPFAEADGGLGGTAIETMIVTEALGRYLSLEPYVASIVLAGTLLRLGDGSERRTDIIKDVSEGRTVLAFAHQEPQAGYDLADVETAARKEGDGWVLDGQKSVVIAGDDADALIVSARASGARFDRKGLCLFLVDPSAPGVVRRTYTSIDGTGGAEVRFSGVKLKPSAMIGRAGKAYATVEAAADVAIAASLSECVGIMNGMLETTVEYLKTRVAFGKKIGEFQALQHRAADMLVAYEQARSMAIFAASMAETINEQERRKAISAAKVQVSSSLSFVSKQSVQLHGGIGITEECAIGPYFKRATALETFLGDHDHHFALFADSDGFLSAPG